MAEKLPRFAARTGWDLEMNRLAQLAESRRRAGQTTLDLTESNPTRCGFIYDKAAILEALADDRVLLYEPQPRGLMPAREAVAEFYAARGVTVSPENILLTSGSSEAYGYLFGLTAGPGDQILVPQPGYPLFEFLSRLHDVALADYRLEYHQGWEIDFHSLEAAAGERTRAVVVVNPNNPTGSLVKPAEREQLVAFCARRGLALISDEVFLEFCLRAAVPPAGALAGTPGGVRTRATAETPAGALGGTPAGAFARPPAGTWAGPPAETLAGAHAGTAAARATLAGTAGALTFTLNGLSKTAALPQMKIGWIVASGPAAAVEDALERLDVIADTYLSVNIPVQWALPKLLGNRGPIQKQVLARVAANLERLDGRLAQQTLCSRLEVEAGWTAILRAPAIYTDEEWALALLEKDGVLVHPGHFFNFAAEGHLVVSLLVAEDLFDEGVRRLLGRVAELASSRARGR